MDAEHKRPFAAFVVVSATSALLLGQALIGGSESGDTAQPAASQTSGRSVTPSSPSVDPANGHAVDGVTPSPTYLPVKSIGRAPTLMARGDDGVGVSTGAVRDPDGTEPPETGGPATGPQGQEPSGTPHPTPSGEPGTDDGDAQGNDDNGTTGPKSPPPHGPWSTGDPPPTGPDSHTPHASPEPSN
jgi:hypothetical protein